ncbi:MAG: 30S ribosomal protein S6 [Planctomycetota bacterium]|nr:30S ribosomal protein S6 [Planctomycetota bacterium]MDA0932164.1 30S ribosomal protein S6 [Planctomycetota bacterium]
MKRTYETMVLLDNREVKQGWQALKDQVCGLFTKHGATIKSAKRWDERRLAYPIQHQLRGTYLLAYYEAETSELAAIRRELEYAEAVFRHMTLACEEIPADAYDPEAEFDESAVRVEDTSMTDLPEDEPEEEAPAEEAKAEESGAGEDAAEEAPAAEASSDAAAENTEETKEGDA